MKKTLLVLALSIICFANLFANDIIIKRNSEKIDAVISEVSNEEVRYKKANNPTGPTFVIKTSEILTIIYSSGEVQTFDNQPSQNTARQQAPQQGSRETAKPQSSYSLYRSGNGAHFQGMVAFHLNYVSTHAGPGADFVFGSRIRDYVYVGGGYGLRSLLNAGSGDYNVQNAFYANLKGYLPVKQNFMPLLDFGIGAHVSICDINRYGLIYYGLYTHVGLGFEYNKFIFSMGYELNVAHTGYFRFGLVF